MRFIVCVKQVPATTEIGIDEGTGTLIREGVETIINPFDEYALEEAVRLKEKVGGIVTAISMGPPQAETTLRDCIARGADEAILITDKKLAGSDTLATAFALSSAIRKIGNFDLIICGKQAIDGDTAQVGPGLAEKLNIPHISYVKKIETINSNHIKVHRLMEDGVDILESSLPALVTVVKDINVPRLPSLKRMILAKKIKITYFGLQDIGVDPSKVGLIGSPTRVIKVTHPPLRPSGEKITGNIEEMAAKLVNKLSKAGLI